jgi:hypothetical protein
MLVHVPWDRYRHRGNLPTDWDGDDLYDAAFGPPPPLTYRPLLSEWDDPIFAVATIVIRWHERRDIALRAPAEREAARRHAEARQTAAVAAEDKRQRGREAAEATRRRRELGREAARGDVESGILTALGQHGPLTIRELARYLGPPEGEDAVLAAAGELAFRGAVRHGLYDENGPVYIRLATTQSDAAWHREKDFRPQQAAGSPAPPSVSAPALPAPTPPPESAASPPETSRSPVARPLFPRDLAVLDALAPDPMTLTEVAAQAGQPNGAVALVLKGLAARGLAGSHNGWYWKTGPGEPGPVPAPEPVKVVPTRAPAQPATSPSDPDRALDRDAAERRARYRRQRLTPLAWAVLAGVGDTPRSTVTLAAEAGVSPAVTKRILVRLTAVGRVVAIPSGRGHIYRRPVEGR